MDTLQTETEHIFVSLFNMEDKRMQDNDTLTPSPRLHLLLLLPSSFLPPPWDIRVSTNPSYPPPPLCRLSTRPSGGSSGRRAETCVSRAWESTAAWLVCFPCLQTCRHSSAHYHGGEEQRMDEGRLHRLQSASCCLFFPPFMHCISHFSSFM